MQLDKIGKFMFLFYVAPMSAVVLLDERKPKEFAAPSRETETYSRLTEILIVNMTFVSANY